MFHQGSQTLRGSKRDETEQEILWGGLQRAPEKGKLPCGFLLRAAEGMLAPGNLVRSLPGSGTWPHRLPFPTCKMESTGEPCLRYGELSGAVRGEPLAQRLPHGEASSPSQAPRPSHQLQAYENSNVCNIQAEGGWDGPG